MMRLFYQLGFVLVPWEMNGGMCLGSNLCGPAMRFGLHGLPVGESVPSLFHLGDAWKGGADIEQR